MSNLLFNTPFAGGAAPLLGGNAMDAAEELKKALTANDGATDVSTFTGGASLGVQSLDNQMKSVVQDNQHFVLFNKLQSTNATNIVDEYVVQSSVGGFPGGSAITQLGTVRSSSGEYKREVKEVKLMAQLRQVGHVLDNTKNIISATAAEERNGALGILTDAEYQILHGNAAACPVHFDGIFTQIDAEITAGRMGSDHVINMNGSALNSVDPFVKLQSTIKKYGSWGTLTDAILSTGVQGDLNIGIDPAFRWTPDNNNNPMIGTHVDSIRLSGGRLTVKEDTFLADGDFPMSKPFDVSYPAIGAANVGIKPASITCTAASDTASMFDTARAGNYYYAVAGIDPDGKGYSNITLSAVRGVTAGQKVTVTIAQSTGGTESGYAVYRGRLGGTNDVSDFRLMTLIQKSGATTVYTDLNRDIPGTVSVPCLNMNASDDAIGWRQFHPMSKIDLPFGVGGVMVYSWFQFMYGYLRITKPKHHGYIKNILPSNATWKPFA